MIRLFKAALLFAAIAGPGVAEAACGPGDPTGLFQGRAKSPAAGDLQVTLNLRCDNGRYAGQLISPVGKLPITGGGFENGQLSIAFDMGGTPASATGRLNGAQVTGEFRVGDDHGPIEFARIGEAVAGDPTQPRTDLTVAEWRQDLQVLASELEHHHGSPFHRVSRTAFEKEVARAAAALSADSDKDYVALDRIANLIGDGHTYLRLPPDVAQMPILLRVFGGDYRVAAAAPGYEQALGARLVAIEGVPITQAVSRALAVTPADETLALRKDRIAEFLAMGMMVHGLGIAPARDRIRYAFIDAAGRGFTLELTALANNRIAWKRPFTKTAIFRTHPEEPFRCEMLPQARTLYCNFRGYDGLAQRAKQMTGLIASEHPEKLVIDMRLNGGGDFNEGLKDIVDPVAADEAINREGRLFVLIGRSTFSAAMSNAAQFRERTHAILVGEPIGERPNTWQEPRESLLPNSRLGLRYSTRFYRFAPNGENLIRPDKDIAPTWAQFAAGDDPVLDWVLARPDA